MKGIEDKELLVELLNEIVILYFQGIDFKQALEQVKANINK